MGHLKFGEIFEDKRWLVNKPYNVSVADKKGMWLGNITYDDEWKCFVFEPDDYTKWSAGCLVEIVNKLNELSKTVDIKKCNI